MTYNIAPEAKRRNELTETLRMRYIQTKKEIESIRSKYLLKIQKIKITLQIESDDYYSIQKANTGLYEHNWENIPMPDNIPKVLCDE